MQIKHKILFIRKKIANFLKYGNRCKVCGFKNTNFGSVYCYRHLIEALRRDSEPSICPNCRLHYYPDTNEHTEQDCQAGIDQASLYARWLIEQGLLDEKNSDDPSDREGA